MGATGALAVFVAILFPTACGGDDDSGTEAAATEGVSITQAPSTEGTAGAMRLTLTDDGCTYEGAESLPSGTFTAEVENQTEYFGAFAVAGVAEGSTIADLEAFVAQSQQT